MAHHPDLFRCAVCGISLRMRDADFPLYCRCGFSYDTRSAPPLPYVPEAMDVPLNIAAKGLRYARAFIRWTLAGCPVRTDAEVARLRAVCAGCKYGTTGECSRCGCRVKGGSWWGDKLRWATEDCPLGKW